MNYKLKYMRGLILHLTSHKKKLRACSHYTHFHKLLEIYQKSISFHDEILFCYFGTLGRNSLQH